MRESREHSAVIAIVDDDPSVRRGLDRLIRLAGWDAETFASAQEFLSRDNTERRVPLLRVPGDSPVGGGKKVLK
jgi:FixJ family two-component response regulator